MKQEVKKKKIFNFEIDEELRKKFAMICLDKGVSMKSFITEALEEKMQKEKELLIQWRSK